MHNIVSRRLFLCFFLIAVLMVGSSQIRTNLSGREMDSLIALIPYFHHDALADHINKLSTSVSQSYPDSCLYFAELAFSLSAEWNYEQGIAEALFNKGNGYYFKNDVRNALLFYFESLALLENKPPSALLGNLYTQIGLLYYYNYSFNESMMYLLLAENIFHQIEDQHSRFYAQRMAFHVYNTDSLNEDAFRFVVERMDFYRDIDMTQYNRALNEMGLIYLALNDSLALDYFLKGYVVAERSKVREDRSVHATNIGVFYTNKPEHHLHFENAEKYFLKAIEIENQTDRYALLAEIYMEYGLLCLKYRKFDQAIQIFNNSLNILQKFDSTLAKLSFEDPSVKVRDQIVSFDSKRKVYKALVEIYNELGDYKKAYEYEVLKNQLHVLMLAGKTKKESELLQAKYEVDKINQHIAFLSKESEIQKLKAWRSFQIIIGLGALFLLMGLLLLNIFRQTKFKLKQEQSLLQQKLLRSQMNPHFIFNSLASVQNFIVKQDDTKASIYLSRFSELVRSILNNSREEKITLEQEISTIENYLELQKVRFPDKFDYNLFVDNRLDTGNIFIPPMLAQPFIENSIEHGIKHKTEKGHVSIRFEQQNGGLKLIIEDDGIGREKSAELRSQFDKDHKSLATSITQERIKVINKKLKNKITLEIIDLKDENGEARGTRVVFGVAV
jgi:tetratricopeptide (TPR) repeat protein